MHQTAKKHSSSVFYVLRFKMVVTAYQFVQSHGLWQINEVAWPTGEKYLAHTTAKFEVR